MAQDKYDLVQKANDLLVEIQDLEEELDRDTPHTSYFHSAQKLREKRAQLDVLKNKLDYPQVSVVS